MLRLKEYLAHYALADCTNKIVDMRHHKILLKRGECGSNILLKARKDRDVKLIHKSKSESSAEVKPKACHQ